MTGFAWLIEAPGQNYLGVRELTGHKFYWTKDHDAALRLSSEEQADGVMMAVRQLNPDLFGFAVTLGEAKPVKHNWLDPAMCESDEEECR